MIINRSVLFAATSVLALSLIRPAARAAGASPASPAPLDGATHTRQLEHGKEMEGEWKVDVAPDDESRHHHHAEEFHDRLIFKGGMFYSETLRKHGFEPVQYDEDSRRDGPTEFTAKCHSKDEGDAIWQGTRTADQLTGTLTWTDPNGDVKNYSFQTED